MLPALVIAVLPFFAADNAHIAAGIVQRIPLIVDSLLHRLGNQKAVPCAVAMLIVVKVRHGHGMVSRRQRAAFTADTNGLIDLSGVKPVELGNWNDATEDLPGSQTPAFGFPPFISRLHCHGNSLINLIAGYDCRNEILATFVLFLCGKPSTRNDACRRMPCP